MKYLNHTLLCNIALRRFERTPIKTSKFRKILYFSRDIAELKFCTKMLNTMMFLQKNFQKNNFFLLNFNNVENHF